MTSSFDKINSLYKIQAALNLKSGMLINVKYRNIDFKIFVKAHQLWVDLTAQFLMIFIRASGTISICSFITLTNSVLNNRGKGIMDLVIKKKNT